MMAAPALLQIRASAGSGKTTRLTADYIARLANARTSLSSGMARHAAGILAVTFTNAAADEMRRRVIDRLKDLALSGESGQAAAWLDIFFSDPGTLNIRTIDSLLHQIVRASALVLNISPDYETEFDVEKVLAPHVDAMLERAREPGPDRDRLRKACAAALKYKNSKGYLSSNHIIGPLKRALPAALSGQFANLADERDLAARIAGMADELAEAAGRLLDFAAANGLKWKARVGSSLSDFQAKKFTRNKPKLADKNAGTDLFKTLPPNLTDAVCRIFNDFLQKLAQYYHDRIILDKGRGEKPFIDLALEVAEAFSNDPLQRNTVLQTLASGWASRVLELPCGVTDALCRLGANLAHFLVDEFQDTGADQWAVLHALVLEALSRGGSFTFVGDVKQSIYGWRGGDPGLFDAPLADSAITAVAGQGTSASLSSNWRSLPAIVEHNNAIFYALSANALAIAQILLGQDAPLDMVADLAGRIKAAYADARQDCGSQGTATGFVSAETVSGGNAEETRDAIADRLVQLLLDDIGPRRPWSDVLILVRSNSRAGSLAAILGANRIPVITENGLLLSENALVIQSLAFLSFLNNLRDDVAFWTVLTGSIFADSPLAAALKETDLAGWAAGRDQKKPLWRAFRDDFREVWERTFGLFLGQPTLLTAYDIVMEWYRRLRVAERFVADQTMLRRFLEVVHAAENRGLSSIATFLEFWNEKGADEKAPVPDAMNAVRIMTIHKAKGLQAPVVIIPEPDYEIKVSDSLTRLSVGDLEVAAALVKDMGRPYHEDFAKQALEALNLLYVAFTRPREELYLIFPESKIGFSRNTRDVMNFVLDSLGQKASYSCGEKCPAVDGHVMELLGSAPPPLPVIDQDTDDWLPMDWLPRLKIYHAEPAGSTLTALQRGTLMHACLEFMDLRGDPRRAAEAALKNALNSCGIAADAEVRKDMIAALVWFAGNTPAADWMSRGRREQPLVDSEGGILRADLIVEMPWGQLVVDYKSGEPDPDYARQLRSYMRVIAQTEGFTGVVRGLIVYLDKKVFQKVCLQDEISLVKPAAAPVPNLVSELPELP